MTCYTLNSLILPEGADNKIRTDPYGIDKQVLDCSLWKIDDRWHSQKLLPIQTPIKVLS